MRSGYPSSLGQNAGDATSDRLRPTPPVNDDSAGSPLDSQAVRIPTFFAWAPDACFVMDRKARFVDANAECERLLGYSREELIGLRGNPLRFPEWDDRARQETPTRHHFKTSRKDGTLVHLEVRYREIEHAGQSLVLGIAREFRDTSAPARPSTQSSTLLHSILDHLPQAVFWKDRSSRIQGANRAAADWLGIDSPEELVGMSDSDLFVSEATAQHCREWDRRVMESNQADFHIIEPATRPDGVSGWLDRTKIPLRTADGEVSGVVVVIEDVTQRIAAEEENQRLQDQLRHSQKMEAVGQLAAGVAHEFNNLLTVIRGNVELTLYSQNLADSVTDACKEIERACERAAMLTGQLLTFARKKKSEVCVFDVKELVANCEPMFRRLLGPDADLEVLTSPAPARVHANESDLEQALLNLVLNARSATEGRGRVSILIEGLACQESDASGNATAASCVRIAVRDDGVGMSEDVAARAFEPFFTTKSPGQGTGLGLSTVYSDITKYGGSVSLESMPGEGTTVHLSLPSATAPVSCRRIAEAKPELGGNETVLVCDDEELVLSALCKLLECVGYDVLGASSGQEAVEMANRIEGKISLLVTDVTMPEMDGIELADQIKQLHPETKVIYSSGYVADRVALGHVSEDHFWEKGGAGHLMLQQIRRVLDRS